MKKTSFIPLVLAAALLAACTDVKPGSTKKLRANRTTLAVAPLMGSAGETVEVDFPNTTVGTTVAASLFLAAGNSPITELAPAASPEAPFSFEGGGYPGYGGDCGNTLPAGGQCVIYVAFSPTAEGSAIGAITLNYTRDGKRSERSFVLRGKGVNAAPGRAVLGLSHGPVAWFQAANPGAPAVQSLILHNSGTDKATGLQGRVAPTGAFGFVNGVYPGTLGGCGGTLDARGSCALSLAFAPPPGTFGVAVAVVSVHFDGAGSDEAHHAGRILAGVTPGSPAAKIGFLSDTLVFPTTAPGRSFRRVVALKNLTYESLSGLSAIVVGQGFRLAGDFPGAGGDCSGDLGPGMTCKIGLEFIPAEARLHGGVTHLHAGPEWLGSLVLAGDSRVFPANTAAVEIAEAPVNFPGTPSGAANFRQLLVVNGGTAAATLGAATFSRSGFRLHAGGNCGATLASGAQCYLNVQFQPDRLGAFTSVLSLPFSGGLAINQRAESTLAGIGLEETEDEHIPVATGTPGPQTTPTAVPQVTPTAVPQITPTAVATTGPVRIFCSSEQPSGGMDGSLLDGANTLRFNYRTGELSRASNYPGGGVFFPKCTVTSGDGIVSAPFTANLYALGALKVSVPGQWGSAKSATITLNRTGRYGLNSHGPHTPSAPVPYTIKGTGPDMVTVYFDDVAQSHSAAASLEILIQY